MSAESGEQAVQGIDAERVTEWFAEHVPDAAPPLDFSLIAGGHSNLTYAVHDTNGGAWVLRRPPLGHVLATAHDMGREHKIISALGATDVPVPPAVGFCEDITVNDAPFYVMDFIPGTVVRDITVAESLPIEVRRTASESVIDVLGRIHAVDVDAVGLGDLGRRDGYIERQLKRWYGQFEKSKSREIPAVDEVHALLSANVPDQGPASIVHGDYRLDNCMIDDEGQIVAVLDWEICTLGDPLADVGLLMVYWGDGDASNLANPLAGTALEGFARPKELLERYASQTGRDLSEIDFYIAFGYWKLACIIEGVYARYVGGAMGERNRAAFDGFAAQVGSLAEAARETFGRSR